MKTITKLGLAVILFMVGTQYVQAQTKEETIAWINTYANDFMYKKININFIEKLDENGNITINRETTNLAMGYWIDDIYYDFDKDRNAWRFVLRGQEKVPSGGQIERPFFVDNEEDCKCVHKAFMHLAKLLGTKPKPKKDTF